MLTIAIVIFRDNVASRLLFLDLPSRPVLSDGPMRHRLAN
jgi:hypothetical protein